MTKHSDRGEGGGAVSNNASAAANAPSTTTNTNNSLGADVSQDGSYRTDGQREYN